VAQDPGGAGPGAGVVKQPLASALIALSLTLLAVAMTIRGRTGDSPRAAAELIVTSAADAGPGTLREAILAADRAPERAQIVVTAKRITIESPLPALVNKHGIDLRAASDAGVIDAAQVAGTTLQIAAATTRLTGIHILNAHTTAIVVDAAAVQLDSIHVESSKVGVLLGEGAEGCVIRSATFDNNEIAVTGDALVADVFIVGSVFRANTRAGLWLVGSPQDKTRPGRAERPLRLVDGLFEKNALGAVIANHPILIQKTRFIDSLQSGVLILGGMARVEDAEFRGSGGNAISVSSGQAVELLRNSFLDNRATAILARDSDITIERNNLHGNASGLVSIISREPVRAVIRDNVISATTGDALTLIGGAPQVQGNRITDNHGVGVRVLDLAMRGSQLKTTPQLDANLVKGNAVDAIVPGVYPLADAL
jgi:hypothetical protein